MQSQTYTQWVLENNLPAFIEWHTGITLFLTRNLELGYGSKTNETFFSSDLDAEAFLNVSLPTDQN